MKIRRVYRQWDTPHCPIKILRYENRRIMPLFSPHYHDDLEFIYIVYGADASLLHHAE